MNRGHRRTSFTPRLEALERRALLSAVAQGSEFHVNTYTTNYQVLPHVAVAANGSFVVVWSSTNQASPSSSQDIFAQRFSAAGTALGSEFRVNTTTAGPQQQPAVAIDDAGDFVVVWDSADGNSTGIWAQRYNSSGVAQGGEFRVNTITADTQELPAVAMDSDGDFVVTWDTYHPGSVPPTDVLAQRYNSSGVAQGIEFTVNAYTTGEQYNPAIAIDSAGDFVVVWSDGGRDGSGYGIFGRRFNAAGTAQGADFSANSYTTGDQLYPAVASDQTGDFIVTWESYQQDADGSHGVYAQRFNSLGVKQGFEFRANSYTTNLQGGPTVAADSAGNFVIAWESLDQNNDGFEVYAQAYKATGALSGGEFRANTFLVNDQDFPAAAMNANGDLVIAWRSWYQESGPAAVVLTGVYAQRYRLDVTPPNLVSSDFHYQTKPHTIRFTFSEDVSASFSASDVTVVNLAGGGALPLQLDSYNTATNTATFSFPAAPNGGVLPDGRYRATIDAAGVTDAAGNPLTPAAPFDFFFLSGDANHDATVNLNDFNILATNFGFSGRDYTQADFNYDTIVNLQDFNILASKFGQSIAPQTFSVAPIGTASKQTRVIDILRDDSLA